MDTAKQQSHSVPEIPSPLWLIDYAIGLFEACLTKSALKKAVKKELISVDGQIAKSGTLIKGGETITFTNPALPNTLKRLVFPLQILFEDDHLALVHKPAGILVSGNGFKTVANALSQNLKPSPLPDAVIPQPIHRLDYATTGVLLIGKTHSSIRELGRQFHEKQVSKTYYAVTIGEMDASGIIREDIDEKPAKTSFEILSTVPSPRFGQLNLVELKPETGRRHQIRKHLSGIGNSILGDKDYGMEGLILNGKGLYLHAASLTFKHPLSKETVTFKSELPKRFEKIFPEVEAD